MEMEYQDTIMKRVIKMNGVLLAVCWLLSEVVSAQPPGKEDLRFDSLPVAWDEGIPLGNGMLGSLLWAKDGKLRLSLDRADLWDMRPMKGLHRKEFNYQWIHGQVLKKDYGVVQQYFDSPYNDDPAPSKIPGAALEFDIAGWGAVRSVRLELADAVCQVEWVNGMRLRTFVQATRPVGWFRFENIDPALVPELIAPKYEGVVDPSARGNVAGDDLILLGYKQGLVKGEPGAPGHGESGSLVYNQEGWGGFSYQVSVCWKKTGLHTVEGVWSISSRFPGGKIPGVRVSEGVKEERKADPSDEARSTTAAALRRGYEADYRLHAGWWVTFWSRSAISVPDPVIEKQWWLEQYKFGSAARRGAPPISLQAVWTADNGRLPPWKGDFHHDLNTQLSYWPCYSGNHLEEGLSYLDHLDANKPNYKRYTKLFFRSPGMAVPGVTTLDGTEMGGWVQYSLSPTVVAWLGQHYYLQWRYSMDRVFLRDRAYPWIREAAVFLESMTRERDSLGHRKLPMSSSPEINDNSLSAWFPQNTNYDLALLKFTFRTAGELAGELGLPEQAAHWKRVLSEFGELALTGEDQLMFAPGMAYNQSHRHFSNMMAIHPLGLIRWEDGDKARSIITHSIALLDSVGPGAWCGYSYSWLANLKARAKDGEGAAKALDIFARAFCSPNSFHLNGDQTKSGYSGFTYRPFTLEGNFAFAAGLQEMLLQSYAGFIEIAPAVPASWQDLSFKSLRAEGAFLVSAVKVNGRFSEVRIVSEKGGATRLKIPFAGGYRVVSRKGMVVKDEGDGFLKLRAAAGGEMVVKSE